ncbi:MAG TPA: hypothetical protein VIJ65_09460 [Acidobacteriaceae bacterium]
MLTSQILGELRLGESIAETDEGLDRYFVNTHTFNVLIRGEKDIIAGDKGTGKTALYRILKKRARVVEELRTTQVVTAFNLTGNPIFQELLKIPIQGEGQYIAFWKTYFLALVGNWMLDQEAIVRQSSIRRVEFFLSQNNLKTTDTTPKGVFSKILAKFPKRSLRSAEIDLGIAEHGMPHIKPKVEYESSTVQPISFFGVDYWAGLQLLESSLKESNLTVWIALDRLDEAFQGFPAVEIPALRALLRTYLDLREIKNLAVKLFLRKDLFRKIISGGFVNLTHVNARKIEIFWRDEDLKHLLIRRVRDSEQICDELRLRGLDNDESFTKIFPNKVSQGEKQSTTWNWIMSRIRDGNGVIAPRNLVDLVERARAEQVQSDLITPREYQEGTSLIEAESIRKAHKTLSKERVEDTLFSEAADLSQILEKFRHKKAEYDIDALCALLGLEEDSARVVVRDLRDVGFLEEVGNAFKVPMLYREGLNIRQGKANGSETGDDD